MKYIDMHCDTLMSLLFHDPSAMNLYDNDFTSISLKKMKEAGQKAQFFAAFMPVEKMWDQAAGEKLSDWEYIETLHKCLTDNVDSHRDLIAMAYSADDIDANDKAGLMSAIFTIEDSRAVDGSLDNIRKLYDMGVRACSLTWNGINCIGYPNSLDPEIMNHGLTEFGRDAVKYMQELGILVDVSHLSEGGFYDVASLSDRPFIATHSNCRSLSPHQRNLTDDQIRVLADHGGITGVNFCPAFLNEDVECKDSSARLMAVHLKHMVQVGGINTAALGSDLDGISGNLEIDGSDKMYLLFDEMKKQGFTEAEIEQIAYQNVERVMREAQK
ncbi:MAG: membrane dipeptidase [Erysipelotrichia bacterium]|nr:membrane dipeptidase [Erysipelotrichia bacterium]